MLSLLAVKTATGCKIGKDCHQRIPRRRVETLLASSHQGASSRCAPKSTRRAGQQNARSIHSGKTTAWRRAYCDVHFTVTGKKFLKERKGKFRPVKYSTDIFRLHSCFTFASKSEMPPNLCFYAAWKICVVWTLRGVVSLRQKSS